jgi:hypothetical protein
LSPFFKGGFFSAAFQPLFGKEGQGRFSEQAITKRGKELQSDSL